MSKIQNHYDTLKIQSGASAQEIKRAYFGLVKQFPPERFPVEFKTLREAYDTLYDPRKRAEYDKSQNVPEEVSGLLEKANELNRLDNHPEAAQILREAAEKYPEQTGIKELLARSLEMEGKNGLAIKIWEELRIIDPNNAEYAKELALSYDDRGWVKKAAKEYAAAVRLDEIDADFWNKYIEFCWENDGEDHAKALCLRAEKALRERGLESVSIYAACIYFLTEGPDDFKTAEKYLADMKRVMQSRPWNPGDGQDIEAALNGIMKSGNFLLFPYIRDMAGTLPRKSPYLEGRLEKAGLMYEAKTLETEGFPEAISDMCGILGQGELDEEYKLDITVMECYILGDLALYRPLINRLKKEHPKLYALNADFFSEAVHTRDPERLLHKREKIIIKKGRMDHSGGDSSQSGTVRRETPKIGRNEPCPCGSGKKYKRCCGAGA